MTVEEFKKRAKAAPDTQQEQHFQRDVTFAACYQAARTTHKMQDNFFRQTENLPRQATPTWQSKDHWEQKVSPRRLRQPRQDVCKDTAAADRADSQHRPETA